MKASADNLINTLINWYSIEKRDLPWRRDPTPYKVWLSEIILQQTRVVQGLPYFERFVEQYPSVFELAAASEMNVLKLWEGLGYYSRARNLHFAARQIVNDHNGHFPRTCHELLKLKGIGPYTAAAIASICFGEAAPVLDGNVYRVIARLYGLTSDISAPKSRKSFLDILEDLIGDHHPGDFNQALMELGAMICLPKSPRCGECPLISFCFAFKNKNQSAFPVKNKRPEVRTRDFHYLAITYKDRVGMKKRSAGDIWQGLYEFALEEGRFDIKKNLKDHDDLNVRGTHGPVRHVLTHQKIFTTFYHVEASQEHIFKKMLNYYDLIPYSWDEVVTLPKSKLIINYLKQFEF